MKKINVGIVGLGYWGPNLIRNFFKSDSFNVKWGCDLLDVNLNKIAKDFPSVSLTKDYQDLLSDPELSLVVIATPAETHYKLASMALNANKHLWVEKPFTSKLLDAENLLKLAKSKKLYLHVDFPFIFSGPVQKIKELLKENAIGKPLYFSSDRTNLGLIQKNVDVLWDLCPHDLSIIFSLFPDIKPVTVSLIGSEHIGDSAKKQIANLVIKFDNGLVSYIHISWLSPAKVRRIILGGTEKMILFDDVEPTEKIRVYNTNVKIDKNEITPFKPVYRTGDIWIPTFNQSETLFQEVEFLAKELQTEKYSYYTAEIAIRILQIFDRVNDQPTY